MGWLTDLIAYIGNHRIAAIWSLISISSLVYFISKKIATQLNQSYKHKFNLEEARLSKLAHDLSTRESLVSEKESFLQEKESNIRQHIADEVFREVSARLSAPGQSRATSCPGKIHLPLPSDSALLPPMYSPLFSSSRPETLERRIVSSTDGSLSIVGPFSCQALIHSITTQKKYQTSLTHCTCEDFKYRGGPCKHMLFLLFSISSTSASSLQELHRSGNMDLEIKKAYAEQAKRAQADLSKLQQEYTLLQNKSGDEIAALQQQISTLQDTARRHNERLRRFLDSNLTSIPWLAGMMADFLTYDYEIEARKLEWGSNIQRQKKVASIRDIRADAKARIQEAKEAVYQLEYLRTLYPALDDVLETDYRELKFTGEIPEYDPIRNYLSKEEWSRLSPVEKDQLALDRYIESMNKSKWQIGRDYELSVAYEYSQKGYHVDTTGNYMKFEDLGRDLIATHDEETIIIQCKYWSKTKTIHEKHIFQLYGTLVMYRLENQNLLNRSIHGVFITNTTLSPMAHQVADLLDIAVVEGHEMVAFPRIKCNIGHDEFGETYIYHLPMDPQYDSTQIKHPGEFYAFTVQEAIDAGFRRAYKWSGKS